MLLEDAMTYLTQDSLAPPETMTDEMGPKRVSGENPPKRTTLAGAVGRNIHISSYYLNITGIRNQS